MSSTAAAHENAPRVRRIYRYPVKSMLGELLEEAAIDEKGLAGDRAFAVVDAEQETVASAKLPGGGPASSTSKPPMSSRRLSANRPRRS